MRGQIYRRSAVSWTIQVYIGRDPVTGKDRHIKRAVRGSKWTAGIDYQSSWTVLELQRCS